MGSVQSPNLYNVEVFDGQQWKVVEGGNYFEGEKKSLMTAIAVAHEGNIIVTATEYDPHDIYFPLNLDHAWRFLTQSGTWEKAFKLREGQGISHRTSFLVPRRYCQGSGFFCKLMKKIGNF